MKNQLGFREIKDEILYHTTLTCTYKVGDVLKFGDDKRGMYTRVYNADYTINGKSAKEELKAISKKKIFHFLGKEKLQRVKKIISDYDFSLREVALEQVRLKKFKNYPSRLTSLFACHTLENAKMWFPLITWQKNNYQFVKLKCTGKIFVGDSWHNTNEGFSFAERLEKADKYWGEQLTETPRLETLFEGTAEVVEILESSNK